LEYRPAVFIDRDGVINANRQDYVKSWGEFVFISGSLDALCQLAGLDWPVVVISNQSAIGHGLLSSEMAAEINAKMLAEVKHAGGRVDGVYVCPHRPDEGCECRKPQPGLLRQAARELYLDLGRSYMIGDAESDIHAGLAVGAQPVLVLSGRGREHRERLAGLKGTFQVVKGLREAVAWIVSRES
jgi:D-glycero-D-manno-heptose 1,7-bisphosphate phosphatase